MTCLRILLIGCLLLAVGCTTQGYEFSDGKWQWVTTSAGGEYIVDLDVDLDSFEIMEKNTAKDKSQVFSRGRLIEGADPSTFEIFKQLHGDLNVFSRDEKHVFLRSWVIPGADPETFRILDGVFSRDAETIFCGTTPVQGADWATFEVVANFGTVQTSARSAVLDYGQPIDTDILAVGWSRDSKHYYYGPVPVQDIDYDSFRVIDEFYAVDKFGKFEGYLRVDKAKEALIAWKKKYVNGPQGNADTE